jgi:aspartate aminotransferase/aromatic-amino-acid transaminase
MFQTVERALPDAILGLSEAFKADTSPEKVNLGVGIYQNEEGKTPTLACVQKAEAYLLGQALSKTYMPITGSPAYTAKVQTLLFGEGSKVIANARAATAHTPGGTGALRVGADFLAQHFSSARIWVSQPTWANHKAVFSAAGVAHVDYPYYDPKTRGLDFEGMMNALKGVPAGDAVLLHVCCHNPTGVDLDPDQWRAVAECAKACGWIPFLDFAYQGFGQGLEEDRAGVSILAEAGVEFFVANSFSKNFGLYCERTGAFTLVGSSADDTAKAFSQVKRAIRSNYSNPPAHGGRIVSTILESEELSVLWRDELEGMRQRIAGVRRELVGGLNARGVNQDFSYIERQRGMFSFSGLTDAQVQWLREEKHIYIVKGGRINVAGVTPKNLDALCDGFAEAVTR